MVQRNAPGLARVPVHPLRHDGPVNNDAPISHHDVETLNEALARKDVAYLFIGKGAAVLHGFPDTTQDVDIFPRKDARNAQALVEALTGLGFTIDNATADEIVRGKDFVQLRNGPFDVDLVFAPDGIESFDDAWRRGVRIEQFPVCGLDDIIESKRQAGRARDRESLPRLEKFRAWARVHARGRAQPLGNQPGTQASPAQHRNPLRR